ncbi:HU family DNA-binding protein [Acidithiobacillus montserratensis]|uniref:HU family DNA-binding protein n=1 Tax=Acidithiobacillus montserratensis TaxID=2729135 RepID=A0ACD5HGC6_9PROT|nr:HU family DNA-binding protein [Acidithiobacillus montserratensis]MBU2748337.1 integration host factor subunit beta [Acidithiobacillus montserratensis]
MNKSDLVENVYRDLCNQGDTCLTRSEVVMATGLILDHFARALAQGERIEIRDFGVFSVHDVAARMGRNPKSGASVAVPEKRTVHFKAGTAMRVQVNQHQQEN